MRRALLRFGGEDETERGTGLVEFGVDAIELLELVFGRRLVRRGFVGHVAQQAIGLLDPVDDVGACGQLAVVGYVVVQRFGDEAIDFELGAVRAARPMQAGFLSDRAGDAAPVVHQIIVGDHGAWHVARRLFGIEHVAQPEQIGFGRREVVAALQRCCDF